MKIIDLSGIYRYETDEANKGIEEQFYKRKLAHAGFKLPGTTCEMHIGKEECGYDKMTKESVRCLRPRYEYIGPIWLQREFEIEEEDKKCALTLFLERVNMASDLWIDGEKIDRQIVELTTPHCYNLTGRLSAGRHTLTLRIDNSNLLNIDGMASGYSRDTQSIWNGIIGRIELRVQPSCHIERMDIYPQTKSVKVKLVVESDCHTPSDRVKVQIALTAKNPKGKILGTQLHTITLYNKRQNIYLEYHLGEWEKSIMYWDEFHPDLYTMTAFMKYESEVNDDYNIYEAADRNVEYEKNVDKESRKFKQAMDQKSVPFGMRTLKTKGRKLLLNEKPIALRGTLDCGIYPMTGHPPMDVASWMKTFKTLKDYGLNHVRFHAWCPPEAAFEAADQIGIYILAEMPFWLNTDVCKLAAGDDPIHRKYFTQEAVSISKSFGNHPSFMFFSNGNELLGDFELLEEITTAIKAIDNRRLYTLTSNFDHPIMPCEDYISAFALNGHPLRVQNCQDEAAKGTYLQFDEAVSSVEIPSINYEVGQYCVYPDITQIEVYTGNLRPVNLEVIAKDMEAKGILGRTKDYVQASGQFVALLYKEEIEAAMRTKELSGIELLGLNDYMGQCTATVGVLDAFWHSKGVISGETFRHFCSPVVPLLKAKRVYQNDEVLKAEFDLYQYGEFPITNPEYEFKLLIDDQIFYEAKTNYSKVKVKLDKLKKPVQLKAALKVGPYENSWDLFVYPKEEVNRHQGEEIFIEEDKDRGNDVDKDIDKGKDIDMDTDTDKCIDKGRLIIFDKLTKENLERIKQGGRIIISLNAESLNHPIKGTFTPVFWSPAFFPSESACGVICEVSHPIFNAFPTQRHSNYQWKQPLEHSISADISSLPRDFKVLIEPIPNFFDNTLRSPLFEAKVGKGKVLFCGFDLSIGDVTIQALRKSILQYAASERFNPEQELSDKQVWEIFMES